jgi:hypothetical protein
MGDYVICCLSKKFYEKYPIDVFPQMLGKKDRPYLALITEIDGVSYAIPFRSHAHAETSYIFKTYFRDFDGQAGLDYSKAVVIVDYTYKGNPARIDSREKSEIDSYRNEIIGNFKKYLDSFKKAMKSKNPKLRLRYQCCSLQYFLKEMGIKEDDGD